MRLFLQYADELRKALWRGVREWCGDTAYERYLAARTTQRLPQRLSREEFYVEQLNRRYSKPNRCC